MIVIGGDYEHTLGAGMSGGGIDIVYRPRPLAECFRLVLSRGEFEASEFSLANYIIYRCTGDDWLGAIPVFPSRVFRHSHVVVRKDSKLHDFRQLAGAKVGLRDYSQTAAVWLRGLLKDEYGVDWREINWVSAAGQRFAPPEGVKLTTTDRDVEDLLIGGEIEAAMLFPPKDYRKPLAERRLRTLLPESQKIERQYFERTGVFPIMHTVVVRKEVLARAPEGARAIFDVYSAAKKAALQRSLGATFIPWSDQAWSAAMDLFGEDSHPYGLTESNRKVIGILARYLHDQRFIAQIPNIDALFPPDSGTWR